MAVRAQARSGLEWNLFSLLMHTEGLPFALSLKENNNGPRKQRYHQNPGEGS